MTLISIVSIKVALCSCPPLGELVSLVSREARERAGLSWVVDGNMFSLDVV